MEGLGHVTRVEFGGAANVERVGTPEGALFLEPGHVDRRRLVKVAALPTVVGQCPGSHVADDAIQPDADQRADGFVQSRLVDDQVDGRAFRHVGTGDRAELIVELREQRTGEVALEKVRTSTRVEHDDVTSVLDGGQVRDLEHRGRGQRGQQFRTAPVVAFHAGEIQRRVGLAGENELHERPFVDGRVDGAVRPQLVADRRRRHVAERLATRTARAVCGPDLHEFRQRPEFALD